MFKTEEYKVKCESGECLNYIANNIIIYIDRNARI